MSTAGVGAKRLTIGAVVLVSLVLMPLASYGQDKYWIGGSGWWDEDANWSPWGQPHYRHNAWLSQSDAVDRVVDYRCTLEPIPLLGGLVMEATGSGTITLDVGLGDMVLASNESVGSSGIFNQWGGTNTVTGTLYVGWHHFQGYNDAVGTYNLSGGEVVAVGESIGWYGTGIFNQTGGTNAVTGGITVSGGNYPDVMGTYSTGTYSLSGTGIVSTSGEWIGGEGTGIFNQAGGTNTITDSLHVGVINDINPYATGTYNLSGGELSVHDETIISRGTFNQWGGTNTVTGEFTLSKFSGDGSTYDLHAGTLSAGQEAIRGGAFNQWGGTNAVTDTLVIALLDYDAVMGTYDLHAGALSASQELIFGGAFNQLGGTNTVTGAVTLGGSFGATGTYNLSGTGGLSAGNAVIGEYATGTFNQSGGTNTTANALDIGSHSGSTGTYMQTGGTNTTDWLSLGLDAGSTGTYDLGDTGVLSANVEALGYSGTATFEQTGGTNTADWLMMGGLYGGTGTATYNLSGGGLSTNNEIIGYSAIGTFTQSGGTHAITYGLALGLDSGSTGTYNLSRSGVLSANAESLGLSGTGTFEQTGGTNTTDWLMIGGPYGGTGTGTYHLSSGQLSTNTVGVGYSGTGTNGTAVRKPCDSTGLCLSQLRA